MDASPKAQPDELEAVGHRELLLGRLLLVNGADTEEAEAAVQCFAAAYGHEAVSPRRWRNLRDRLVSVFGNVTPPS